MRKEKPKRGDNPHHIEFVTSLKQEECVARLETLRRSGLFEQMVELEFFRLDANTCEFVIVKGVRARIRGHLINEYGLTTKVEGYASLTTFVIVAIGVMIFFAIFIIISSVYAVTQGNHGNLLLLVYPLASAVTAYAMLQQPRRLAADIRNLLLEPSD